MKLYSPMFRNANNDSTKLVCRTTQIRKADPEIAEDEPAN